MAVRKEAEDIISLDLAPAQGRPLAPFTAGAHIDVRTPGGAVRQYSLCNGPDERAAYRIAVKREPDSRGGSASLHERVRPGDQLMVSEPRNHFPLAAGARVHLLFAAGIGVTPIVSMARHLLAGGGEFRLHYFTRSPEHTAFKELLSSEAFGGRVSFHTGLDAAAVNACVRQLLQRRAPDAHLYLCGPRAFMDAVRAAAAHWPAHAVHVEYFAGAEVGTENDQGFELRLARSGKTYLVPPGRTIIEVLAENGVQVDVSCEQGVCGTCITTVLEGVPDHRDLHLTDDERRAGDKIMLCVSRAKSPLLTIDL